MDWYNQLKQKGSIADNDIKRQLERLDMQDRWQAAEEDNVDATNPLELDVYIPETTAQIQQVVLRIKLKAFRSYSSTTAAKAADVVTSSAGGATVTTSAYDSVDYGNLTLSAVATDTNTAAHDHGITNGTVLSVDGGGTVTYATFAGDSHSHDEFRHNHQITLADHTHDLTVPEHTHAITPGIFTSTTASGVTITINGIDRTNALVGAATFDIDKDNLDVTDYMTATGYNTIALASATLGRIRCTAFVHLYVKGG